MNLGTLLLAVWLILLGIDWMGWVVISIQFLGIWAFVTGIVLIVESFNPVVIGKRP